MKLKLNNEVIKNMMTFNLPILLFSLVVNHQFQNALIIYVSLITVFYLNLNKIPLSCFSINKYVLIPISILFILILGVIYSANTGLAWQNVTRSLGLIFLPILVSLNSFNFTKKIIFEMFKLLEIAVFILISISVIFVFVEYFRLGTFNVFSENSGALVGKLYSSRYLSNTIGLHNIYFSFFISILILFKIIIQKKYTSLYYWISLCILFTYFLLLRSANITVILSLLILIFILFKVEVNKMIKIVFLIIFSLVSGFVVKSKIPHINLELNYTKPYYISSLELRLLTWNVALENIQKNPFVGVGTGDMKDVMYESFLDENFTWGIEHRYDPHNQFLSYWLQNGIIQLMLFILLLLFPLYKSLKDKNYFTFCIIVVLSSFCLTESVFMTQTGLFGALILLSYVMFSKVKFD